MSKQTKCNKQHVEWIKIGEKWPQEQHFVIVYSNANAWLPSVDYAYWKEDKQKKRCWYESIEDEKHDEPLCAHGQEVFAWTELPDPGKVSL
jgi:hypothetical protein